MEKLLRINRLLKSEIFKSRWYKPIWFFLFIGVLFPLLVDFSRMNIQSETFLANMKYAKETNHFIYFSDQLFILLAFLTPLLVTMSVLVIVFQEASAESWKYYFVAPFSFGEVIISKIIASILLLIILVLTLAVTHLFSSYIVSNLRPDLGIEISGDTIGLSSLFILRIVLSGIAIIPLVWLVSFFSQSYFLISIITSLFFLIISLSFNPYTFPFQDVRTMFEFRKALPLEIKDNISSYGFSKYNLGALLYLILGCTALVLLKDKIRTRIYKL